MEELTKEELLDRFEECYKTLNYRRTGKDLSFLFDWVESFCTLYNIPCNERGDWHCLAGAFIDYELYRACILGLWEYINEEGETRWIDEIRE